MKRIIVCFALLALGVAASAQVATPPPRRTPTPSQPLQMKALPAVQLSPTVKASLERPDAELRSAAMRGLNLTDRSHLQRVVNNLKGGNQAAGQREWQSMIGQLQARPGGVPMDINSLIQYVLRQSYLEGNKDLQLYADKVQHFNEVKKALRDEMATAHSRRAALGSTGRSNVLKPAEFRPTTVREPVLQRVEKAPPKLSYRRRTLGSKSEWEAYIKQLEQNLQTVGDDAQLAQIDLQNALQKQQQTVQTLSNVSKMLHDTAMAVIRKIG